MGKGQPPTHPEGVIYILLYGFIEMKFLSSSTSLLLNNN